MLGVIVVEDDIVARNRICSMVDWESLGFSIVAEVSNGLEALRLVKSLKPKLVIADVSMPVMDGVELSRELSKLDDSIYLVMVSSYSNYDYIRETFKNGALDYLLKDNLSPEVLTKFLTDIKQKVATFQGDKEHFSPQNQLVDLLLGVSQRTYKIQSLLDALGFSGDTEHFILLAFRMYYYDYMTRDMDSGEKIMQSRSILAFVDELFHSQPHSCLWMGPGQIVVLMEAKKASLASLQLEVEEAISRVDNCLLKYLDARAQHGWIKLSKKNLEGGYKVLLEKMDVDSERPEMLAFPYIMKIIDALEQTDAAAIEVYLKDLFSELKEDKATLWSVQPVVRSLLNLLDQVIGWQKLSIKEMDYVVGNIYHCNSLDELQQYMQKCFRATVLALKAVQGRRHSPHVENAMLYIREHYHEHITLSKVAAHVGVAPSYLSGQFSSETGMTFVEYLNKIRIDAAEKIMQTTACSIKEVYHQVGFNSYNYFFKVYKDIKGESPAQRNRKT